MSTTTTRLARHLAAATAAACAVSANAQVIYRVLNAPVGATIDGLYINVQTGATYDGANADTAFAGWDLNPYGSTTMSFFWSGTANGPSAGVRLNTVAGGTTNGSTLSSLPFGFVVGPALIGGTSGASFGTGSASFTTTSQGKWNFNANNYFGFRFTASDGGVRYGWGKMLMGATATTRTIVEIAYESTPGLGISVGDTGSGGAYDPCSPTNQALAVGSNVLGINSTAADLGLGGCSAGLTAFKANYFKFVAPATRNYDISTCSGTADTVMAVLNGCASGSSVLACNDNFCGTGSQITLSATAGSTYYVALGSATSTALTSPVSVVITPWYDPCDPANPTVAVGNNSKAVNQTTATNLNVGSMVISKANYYKFTPTVDGTWNFSTCNSGAATRMAIMADCAPGSTVIASDDNSCSNGSSAVVSASLTSGVPVYVVVGGEGSDIPSPIEIVVGGPPVPVCVSALVAAYGDNPIDSTLGAASAQSVYSTAAQVSTSTTLIYKPQWFKFTPTATGAFTFKSCLAGDTKMSIGTACPTVGAIFNTIAYNDDAPNCLQNTGSTLNYGSWLDATNNGATGANAGFPLTQNLVAGTTYYICVGGFGSTNVVNGLLNISGPQGNPCPGDLDGDGSVGGADLGLLLGAWGACPGTPCLGDLNLDGEVNGADLGLLLGQWGPCP
ncbi:MAG: hypothetical protein ACKPBA_11445 [Planctomycetota bacterium]